MSLIPPFFQGELVDTLTPSRKERWGMLLGCVRVTEQVAIILYLSICVCVRMRPLPRSHKRARLLYASVPPSPPGSTTLCELSSICEECPQVLISGCGVKEPRCGPWARHVARSTTFSWNICTHGRQSGMYKYRLTRGKAASGPPSVVVCVRSSSYPALDVKAVLSVKCSTISML